MKAAVSAAGMTAAEIEAFKTGLTPQEAMERAGAALAEHAARFSRIFVCAWCGNNGGDGFVAARLLHDAGKTVAVRVFGDPKKLSDHARKNYEAIRPLITEEPMDDPDCVIDALFGIGFHGELTGEARAAAALVNGYRGKAYVLAADVPSGLSADTGKLAEGGVTADETVTFGAWKYGHFLGLDACGHVSVQDIGIPVISGVFVPEKADIVLRLQKLPASAHKGTCGHVGVIAGSRGMEGAGALAALAALRSGAGKVSLSVPEACVPFYDRRAPEIMVSVRRSVKDFIRDKDTVLFGPGLGRDGENEALLDELLETCTVPLIIDADGLWFLTREKLKNARCEILLTPHMGEAAHLFGCPISDLMADPFGASRRFLSGLNAKLLLKSHYHLTTVGETQVLSHWGCPGMATAGSGDVLAGLTAGLRLRHSGEDTLLLASYLHGTAGRLAEKEKTPWAMIASDVCEQLPAAFKTLTE